jgi:hypothetical protein
MAVGLTRELGDARFHALHNIKLNVEGYQEGIVESEALNLMRELTIQPWTGRWIFYDLIRFGFFTRPSGAGERLHADPGWEYSYSFWKYTELMAALEVGELRL